MINLKKHIKASFIVLFLTTNVYPQNIVITNSTLNILYSNIANPIEIIIEGVDCKKTVAKTTHGTIQKYSNCQYVIQPENEEDLTIDVFVNNKKIGSRKFRVEKLIPYVFLNTIENASGAPIINTATSLVFRFKNTSLDLNYNLSYRAMIIRNNEVIYSEQHNKRLFDDTLKNNIRKLRSGDILLFHDIVVSFESIEKTEKVPPISFSIP